ncbi:MAG: adenylosuccinate synthetase, partial [Nanoarchaeota archaeon]|nr:adenylosuccinate synthetase [Nanoarchaeota archaeon]
MPVLVERYNGGRNAGHTVEIKGQKFALHQIPCGVLHEKTYSLTGEQCLVDPVAIMQEIQKLREQGAKISPKNFGIASNAHVTLTHHIEADRKNFEKDDHTSTGSGILPTAVDKYGRTGVRFQEFLDTKNLATLLENSFFIQHFVTEQIPAYEKAAEFLKDFSVLQSDVRKTHGTHYHIGEGAQGFLLDIDKGLAPGTTSTSPTAIPFPTDTTLGVVKLYESSIGSGRPFIGQIEPRDLETRLRNEFGEFGTTTTRPRNLGWLDIVALKHAIDSTNPQYLVGTCGDRLEILSELKEPLKIVTGYKINGKTYDNWDKTFHHRNTLYEATPV